MLSDTDAERAVLSILLNNSKDVYIGISDLGIVPNTFTLNENKAIYSCIQHCFEFNEVVDLDVPMVISASKSCGYEFWFSDDENKQSLEDIKRIKANEQNLPTFAKKIKKLEVIRNISDNLDSAKDKILDFDGTESIGDVFGVIEDKVLNMSSNIIAENEAPVKLSDVVEQYIQDKIENPIEQVGLSSGFPKFDHYMGGGLRNGSIYVLCARAKAGKSLFLNKIGNYAAKELNIPVLYLFLEMSWEDQVDRMLASATQIPAKEIETGRFASNPMFVKKIRDELKNIKNSKFYCRSIAGKSAEDQLNMMRRWVVKEVGLNKDGTAKPCLILYDYVRLSDATAMKNMREDQAVGFLVENLSHFAVKYKLPIVTAAQLNRSGLTVMDESAVGISDRIIWFASGICLMQEKTEDEKKIKGHGEQYGNKKLYPILARYGPGIEPGNYINVFMRKDICDITEGETAFDCIGLDDQQETDDDDDNGGNAIIDNSVPF